MQPELSSLVFLQYLTAVFDNIADAILLINVEPRGKYRLLLANNAFFTASGYTRDVVGKEVIDIVPPENYPALLRQYQRAIRTKKPVEYTKWSTVPKGKRAFKTKLIPILNTVGDTVQIAALTHDITDYLNLQEEVRRLRADKYLTKPSTS